MSERARGAHGQGAEGRFELLAGPGQDAAQGGDRIRHAPGAGPKGLGGGALNLFGDAELRLLD